MKNWEYMARKKQTVGMGKKEINNLRCKEVRGTSNKMRVSDQLHLNALGGCLALQGTQSTLNYELHRNYVRSSRGHLVWS